MESDTPEMQAILCRIETLEKENMRLKRTALLRRPYFILTLGACVLFVAGVAVGQKARESKFNDYWEPRRISGMEWLLLQAQVDAVRDMVEENGIQAPELYYDSRANKIGALALVDGKYLEKQSAKSVRDGLETRAFMTMGAISQYITNVTAEDFEMEFRAFDIGNKAARNEPGKQYYIFAEYKNGQLILH